MSLRFSLVAAGICIGVCASPALADPLTLEPSTDWKLREYDDKCRMNRVFGSGDDRVTLWLDQGGVDPSYNLTLIGGPMRSPYGANISIQFAPGPEYSRAYLKAKSSKGRPVISLFGARLLPTTAELKETDSEPESQDGEESVDWANGWVASVDTTLPSPEQIFAITELRLGRALIKPVTLRTGSLTTPLADLQSCAEKLEEQIKVNTALAATPVKPTQIGRWARILQQNYPRHMLRAEQEGRIGVRLTIGTNGRPSYCEVTSVVGPTSFNDTVCLLLLKHATFESARDESGKPVAARYATMVTFRLN